MKKTYLFLFLLISPLFIIAQDISVKRNYYKNGLVARESYYNADNKITNTNTYHVVGGLKEVFLFDNNGQPHGKCYQNTSEGKLKTTWEFDHGNLINRTDHIVEFNIKNKAKVEANIGKIIEANNQLRANPKSINSFFKRAAAREFLGNNVLAEQDYLRLKIIFEKMKTNKSTQDSTLILKVNKTLANVYDRLAFINASFGFENKAIQYFLLGIKTDLTDTRIIYNLASYLHDLGQNHTTLYYLDKVLEVNPNHSFANWTKAGTHLELGQYELALKHINLSFAREDILYERGSGTSENDLRTIRGLAYHKLGQSDLGIADLNEALQINNKNSVANKYLGIIYADLGQKEKACVYFQKSRELHYEKMYYPKNLQSLIDESCKPVLTVNSVDSLLITNKKTEKNNVIEIISEVEKNDFASTKNSLTNPTTTPYISPNPAIDNVEVYNFDQSDFRFKMYDIESSLVREGMAIGKTITVTGLSSGLYLLTIEKGSSKHTFKLIKQ